MPRPHGTSVPSSSRSQVTWRPTKIMNFRDLPKDDDFLSHLLVEKVGTGSVPLLVHKMDPTRRLPKVDSQDLMNIVRRLAAQKAPISHSIRQAVDSMMLLDPIRYYIKGYTQKQINAFATHASRYLELYNPNGYIEIAHTSRYSHRTGKSELCILATRYLPAGTVITELKGSMANLTEEQDRELKRTDLRNCDVRRDFSVIHSKQMKKNHLFLGPARFVNHDCDNNCELFREGKYITFRTLRPIQIGEEITAHYGDGYFGRKNRHCLCETCEKHGRGGYNPIAAEEEEEPVDDSDSSSDESSEDSSTEQNSGETSAVNLNERRTRRGVYTIMTKDDSDDSDEEEGDDDVVPLANAPDIPADIELTTEAGTPSSDLTSINSPSRRSSTAPPNGAGPSTPKSPFRSIIATRLQKSREKSQSTNGRETPQKQLVTPPTSEESNSPKRVTRSISKGKEKESTPAKRGRPPKTTKKDEVEVKKEEAEPRLLRARPSPAVVETVVKPPPKPEVPKGPDGKPLPLCVTCRNILPVISVDSQVVWGLGFENASKKKKNKLECPRCLRHAAIYGQPWPSRTPGAGSLPTPREESLAADSSKRLTKHSLSAVDRKLAAAAKIRKREDSPAPATKRRKIEAPSVKLSKKVPKTFLTNRKRHSLPIPPPTEKRKRGRPRLSSPRAQKSKTSSITAAGQPRAHNGRFERKFRSGRRSSTMTVPSKSAPVSPVKDENRRDNRPPGCRTSPRRKRGREDEPEEHPKRKSPRRDADGDESDKEDYSPKKALPRPLSNFKAGMFSRPNPLSFARQAWGGSVSLDEPATVTSDNAVVEDTVTSQPVSISAASPAVAVEPISTPTAESRTISSPRGILTYKPSPTNFARRRWGPPPTVEKADQEKPTPEQPKTRRVSLYATVSCTHILDDKASMLNVDPNACSGDLVHVYPPLVKKVPDVFTPRAFKETTNEAPPKLNLVNAAGWEDIDQPDY